jgi:Tfp pilus assembly protein PilF
LEIWKKVKGQKHPFIAMGLVGLGTLFYEQGDLARARSYLEHALEINLEWYGENHLTTANCYSSLGVLLMRQGDLARARSYLEHALEIHLDVLGENHPSTAYNFHNLGHLLMDQERDLAGAMKNIKRALMIWEAELGREHPRTREAQGYVDMIEEAMVNEAKRRLVEGTAEERAAWRKHLTSLFDETTK